MGLQCNKDIIQMTKNGTVYSILYIQNNILDTWIWHSERYLPPLPSETWMSKSSSPGGESSSQSSIRWYSWYVSKPAIVFYILPLYNIHLRSWTTGIKIVGLVMTIYYKQISHHKQVQNQLKPTKFTVLTRLLLALFFWLNPNHMLSLCTVESWTYLIASLQTDKDTCCHYKSRCNDY